MPGFGAIRAAFRRDWPVWIVVVALVGFLVAEVFLPASTASTIAASVAAVAAVVALVYARWILREAYATTVAQGQTVTAMGTLTERVESSITHLQLIVAETQALRELDELTRIADQVTAVIALVRRVKTSARGGVEQPAPRWELAEQQRMLSTLIAGSAASLPKCLEIANDVAATSEPEAAHVQATEELKKAMTEARVRLARASAAENAVD